MRCCPMADSQLILELMFLHIRGGCSLTVLLFFLMLVEHVVLKRVLVYKNSSIDYQQYTFVI